MTFIGTFTFASREGQSMSRQLSEMACDAPAKHEQSNDCVEAPHVSSDARSSKNEVVTGEGSEGEPDDSDMVIIEEDHYSGDEVGNPTVAAVRLSDYSRLFARLRRGGRMKSSS